MAASHTRAELLDFLDYAKSKGLMKAATAESRKAAVNQVLGILDESEASDISLLDIDHVLDRFQTKHGKRYSPASLRTYRARVKNSIEDFIRYQSNPMDFRPRVSQSVKLVRPVKRALPAVISDPVEPRPQPVYRANSPTVFGTSTLPIPIRPDLTILVHGLPFDLTEGEARKISNVVLAMAMLSSPNG